MTRDRKIAVRRVWLQKLLLLLGSLALTVALAEVALRLIDISFPIFRGPDATTGVWHLPGLEGSYSLEGESTVSINSRGLRDREHGVAKSPEGYRIAILGDSYAAAFEVDVTDTFWAVMARELEDCPSLRGRQIEPINFGVSGFGTAQELLVLRDRVPAYDPDFVLLAFVHNDVRNNSRKLEGSDGQPYFVMKDGELILDASFVESDSYRLRTSTLRSLRRQIGARSRVLQLVNEVNSIRSRRALAARSAPGVDHMFGPPTTSEWKEAWAVTDALLLMTASEVSDIGAGFLLVGLSDHHQVNPDPEIRRQFIVDRGASDLRYTEKRLASIAEQGGFQFLELADPFLQYAEANHVCLHGFDNAIPCGGHWNEAGHRLGGQLIARAICEQLAGNVEGLP
jgi:hypothetical protein